MNIQKMLSDAKKLGLPETDKTKITTLSETYNNQKAQLNAKLPKNHVPEDLYGTKAGDTKYDSKTKLLRSKKDAKTQISEKKEEIKELKKEKKNIFWTIVDSIKRAAETRRVKKQIKAAQKQKKSLEEHIEDIDYTIQNLDEKARNDMQETETKLSAINESIQTQLKTQQTLITLTKMMKKIDLNDKKYAPLIKFFNENSKKTPSLDKPLPAVPENVQALITEFRIEKAEKTIITFSTGLSHTYTASKEAVRKVYGHLLEGARNTFRLPQPKTAGGEGR